MQLSEVYSSSCGLKINKPRVYDLYFPFVEEHFITIDTENTNYPYWGDVIFLLLPYLNKKSIKIFELGDPKSPSIPNVNRTNGSLKGGQKSFLLRKSKLHVGSIETFSTHFFAALDKKLICLVDEEKSSLPFSWGDSKNHNFVYPKKNKFIEPERLAKIILNNLNIDFNYEFETVFIGEKYKDGHQYIESFPNATVPLKKFNIDNVLVRMDLNFSEETLIAQLQTGRASIYTDRPININILNSFQKNINEIIYEIKDENDPQFCEQVKSLGITCNLISYLPEEKINSHKLNYMEIGNIHPQKNLTFKDLPDHDKLDADKLFYRSKRFLFKNGVPHLSEEAIKNNIQSSNSFDIQKVINTDNFWKSSDALCILKKIR
jgi:hypothetical protein